MKRFLALLLAMLLLLSACGRSEKAKETTPQEPVLIRQTQPPREAKQPQQETQQETQPETTAEPESSLPPAPDQVYPQVSFQRLSRSTNGERSVYYVCQREDQVISVIESYIAYLSFYGYTLVRSEVFAGCFYGYWLESSDPSLETVTYRGQQCHMAIEGSIDPEFGWKDIGIYYSPTIYDYYAGENTDEPAGGGGTGGGTGGGGTGGGTETKIRCSKCGGDGEMSCTNCDGLGYKETRVSAPNYSGKGVHYETVKETCYKCHRRGTITCTRCDGEGKHS